jgi:hypothetical protein
MPLSRRQRLVLAVSGMCGILGSAAQLPGQEMVSARKLFAPGTLNIAVPDNQILEFDEADSPYLFSSSEFTIKAKHVKVHGHVVVRFAASHQQDRPSVAADGLPGLSGSWGHAGQAGSDGVHGTGGEVGLGGPMVTVFIEELSGDGELVFDARGAPGTPGQNGGNGGDGGEGGAADHASCRFGSDLYRFLSEGGPGGSAGAGGNGGRGGTGGKGGTIAYTRSAVPFLRDQRLRFLVSGGSGGEGGIGGLAGKRGNGGHFGTNNGLFGCSTQVPPGPRQAVPGQDSKDGKNGLPGAPGESGAISCVDCHF